MMVLKCYSELKLLTTFEERYEYLRLSGKVGLDTFGFDRYLNQILYRSRRWLSARDKVIIRDLGCDLGVEGYEIHNKILVHHMNPITVQDIELGNNKVFDPEFLICTSFNTHNAIHFGDGKLLPQKPITRTQNDMAPWLQERREL